MMTKIWGKMLYRDQSLLKKNQTCLTSLQKQTHDKYFFNCKYSIQLLKITKHVIITEENATSSIGKTCHQIPDFNIHVLHGRELTQHIYPYLHIS